MAYLGGDEWLRANCIACFQPKLCLLICVDGSLLLSPKRMKMLLQTYKVSVEQDGVSKECNAEI